MAYNFIHDDCFDGSLMPLPTLHKAVWAWVISKAKPDAKAPGGGSVLAVPRVLVAYFPDQTAEAIAGVLADFCAPDPESRTEEFSGARLISLGRDKYAVTGYTKHAGSSIARATERKREWRARKEAVAGDGIPTAEPQSALTGTGPTPPASHVPRGTPLTMSPSAYAKMLQGHAFVGDQVQIPNVLHDRLMGLLDPNRSPEAHAKLLGFYQHLNETRNGEPIPNIFKWVEAKFEPWLKAQLPTPSTPAAADDDAYARQLERSSQKHSRRLAQEKPDGSDSE